MHNGQDYTSLIQKLNLLSYTKAKRLIKLHKLISHNITTFSYTSKKATRELHKLLITRATTQTQ
jgi:hypothetical protein